MPRLSLYKPEKGKDYSFLDRQILEMFTIGGTDLHIHKYLGPANPDDADATADRPQYNAVKETNIQDLLFMENRDRKYDPDVYTMRGIYNVQDNDFSLSQFGMFLDNDTLSLTIHINSSVKTLGRKMISGDVIELPHMKDEYAANDYSVALKRFYVVEDVNRASEGFSPTWYPHLYRLKLKQIVDSQEFKEILDLPADENAPGGNTLRDMLSTFEREMQINNAVVDQAEADAPKSGYDTSSYYSLEVNSTEAGSDVQVTKVNNETVTAPPAKLGYNGYLLGDENVPNGANFGHGLEFPAAPTKGDYFLRTDFMPKRMFQYDGAAWRKVHDVNRMTMTNTNDRSTQKGTFINNTNYVYNEKVASASAILNAGNVSITTSLPYPISALYLELKYKVLSKNYVIADHPELITSNSDNTILITLPEIANVQDAIEYDGQWTINFYNNRESERQSLSKALRPKADN
tara:strand:+ start:847 stop:2229 length:1383 start_codon:yes stop_codon:yes gene_type:complete